MEQTATRNAAQPTFPRAGARQAVELSTPNIRTGILLPLPMNDGLWPERLFALACTVTLVLFLFSHFHVHANQGDASDFKTMYASAACFHRGLNAYVAGDIAIVFNAYAIVQPQSWYAHAAVYPPFTLTIVEPLTAIPMYYAAYVWLALNAAIVGAALVALVRYARDTFGLGRGWRMAILAAVLSSSTLIFALQVGNVSPGIAGLCTLALLPGTNRSSRWLRPACLTLALLLKPHTALWTFMALVLLSVFRKRSPVPALNADLLRDRATTLRTIVFTAAALALITLTMALRHQLIPQWTDYFTTLHSELSGGSMDPLSHEFLPVLAQITSLSSLLGFLTGAAHPKLTATLLLTLATVTTWTAMRMHPAAPATRLLVFASASTFGLLASYHRDHDALVLMSLLPLLIAALASPDASESRGAGVSHLAFSDGKRLGTEAHTLSAYARKVLPWATVACLAGLFYDLGIGPNSHPTTLLDTAGQILRYRQAPLSALLLLVVLQATATGKILRTRS